MSKFFDRDGELEAIGSHLQQAVEKRPNYLSRLLILQGTACVGKTCILNNLEHYVQSNLSKYSYRVVGMLDVSQLVEDARALHDAFDRCAGTSLRHSGSLADHAQALENALTGEGRPLLVRLDNIESMALNKPCTRDVRNLLLLRLLRNPGPTLPVVFVCTARHVPSHKISYFTHTSFQAACQVIPIQPFESLADLQRWLGLSQADARQVWLLSAGNAGVAKFLAGHLSGLSDSSERQEILRGAIGLLMQRQPLSAGLLEALHGVMRQTKNRFQQEDFESLARDSFQPLTELMKSSFVDYDDHGRFYFVCSPLDKLLQEVDHV